MKRREQSESETFASPSSHSRTDYEGDGREKPITPKAKKPLYGGIGVHHFLLAQSLPMYTCPSLSWIVSQRTFFSRHPCLMDVLAMDIEAGHPDLTPPPSSQPLEKGRRRTAAGTARQKKGRYKSRVYAPLLVRPPPHPRGVCRSNTVDAPCRVGTMTKHKRFQQLPAPTLPEDHSTLI